MSTSIVIDLRHVAKGLAIAPAQVQAVVELLDEGNTVPFITRYRKDQTGGLDEEQIRRIQDRLTKLRQLADRKQTILRSIESQGKLTEDLARAIAAAETVKDLEDLYLPYKPRKQTWATLARQRGLEPLAREILEADPACADLDARARDFVNPDKQVPTAADALLGAGHILAEWFSERAELRQKLRTILHRTGRIVSTQTPGVTEAAKSSVPTTVVPSPALAQHAESAQQPTILAETDAADTVAPPASNESGGSPPENNTTADRPTTSAATELPTAATTDPVESTVSEPTVRTADPHVTAASTVDSDGLVEGVSAEPTPAMPSAAAVADGSSSVASTEPTDNSPSVAATTTNCDGTTEIGPVVDSASATASSSSSSLAATLPSAQPQSHDAPTAVVPPLAEVKPLPPLPPLPSPDPRAAKQAAAKARKAERKAAEREQRRKRLEENRLKAYRDYFDFSEEVRKIPPHRVLAINRGERAKLLRVRIECDLEAMHAALDEVLVPAGHPHADYLRGCARDALTRLILPSLERELRRELTDKAEAHAVKVFAKNLRKLLLQPPVRDRRVLAIDPALRSGCKLAAIDQFGSLLEHGIIYLVGKPDRRGEAREKIVDLVKRHELNVIAIGNGMGCRETEEFIVDLLGNELKDSGVGYVIVNEAGASVYSTSPIGREELPQFDATLRGAISIGRRLLDPLSELVKIEPANLGVGLYQHDLKAKHLQASLDEVVESCVNFVGVELNTASPSLLRYVSGLNQLTARRVYEHRCKFGPFKTRRQLLEVNGFGEATFVQAAGFLKISGGDDPLDATWIHPESYPVATALLEKLGFAPVDLRDKEKTAELSRRIAEIDRAELAKQLGVGQLTFDDILAQLTRPGRDPREDLPPPVFKKGILKFEDLQPGMELSGTVLNVVDFGAFVDIGMRDCGLVHVSHMAQRFVRDPHEVVAVGDTVRVWVLEVDKERRRVSLTMLPPGTERTKPPVREGRPPDRPPRGQVGSTPADGAAAPADAQPAGSTKREGPPRLGRPPRDGQGRPPRSPEGNRPRDDRRPRDRGTGAPSGRNDQSNQERRPRRDDRGGRGTPRQYDTSRTAQKPLTPITEKMKQGKEPLRTFGDLLQYFQYKQQTAQATSHAVTADGVQATPNPTAAAAPAERPASEPAVDEVADDSPPAIGAQQTPAPSSVADPAHIAAAAVQQSQATSGDAPIQFIEPESASNGAEAAIAPTSTEGTADHQSVSDASAGASKSKNDCGTDKPAAEER